MTAWTNISTASLGVGKPGSSAWAIAVRDNPIAIAEGASGAPKVQAAGLNLGITSVSGTLAAASSTSITLNILSFFPSCWGAGVAYTMGSSGGTGANINAPKVILTNTTGSTVSYDLKWYYIG